MSAASVLHCLAPDLEFGVLAATGALVWMLGLCSLVLAVCWRITTPVKADPVGAHAWSSSARLAAMPSNALRNDALNRSTPSRSSTAVTSS